MFSYLRPHRRAPSTPTSPVPDQVPSWEGPMQLDHAHPQRFQHGSYAEAPTKLSPPPTLAPIARVSSAGYTKQPETDATNGKRGKENDIRNQNWDSSSTNTRGQDMENYSNQPRMAVTNVQRPDSSGKPMPQANNHFQYSRPQTSMQPEASSRQRPQLMDRQTLSEQNNRPVGTGRRPTGARLPTPPSGSNPVSTFEAGQSRTGKRLNLLNPMSLLARRRTSQAVAQLSAESLKISRTGNDFNESFDPRIKGTVVHDFSAPRQRRIVPTPNVRPEEGPTHIGQYQKSPNAEAFEATNDESKKLAQRRGSHTPVFTEDFEEEQYPAAGPHVRKASDFSDLTLPNLPYAGGARMSLEPTSKFNNQDSLNDKVQPAESTSILDSMPDRPPPVPPKSTSRPSTSGRISINPISTQPKASPSGKRRSRNVSQVSAKDIPGFALPKHMKSTSSRFSFDMIGAAEQERLLEDRHRQRALERKSENADTQDDDPYDDYDYDNMDDDDGLEERIPGVNADYDEEDPNDYFEEEIPGVNADALEEDEPKEYSNENTPSVNVDTPKDNNRVLADHENIAGLKFRNSVISPLSPYSPGMISTPRDANGEVIGFAMTKNSPNSPNPLTRASQDFEPSLGNVPPNETRLVHYTLQDLKLGQVDPVSPPIEDELSHLKNTQNEFAQSLSRADDDDLYYDDGLIEEVNEGDDGLEFDESVFDNVDTDEYGRPLKALSSVPTLYSPPNLTADPSPSFNKILDNLDDGATAGKVKDEVSSPENSISSGPLGPQVSVIGNNARISAVGASSSLTQDKLAAYQSALAAAAFTAAANGKFRRDSTPSHQTPSEQGDHPGLVTDSSRTSHQEPFSPTYDYDEHDDFDYDDAIEDDDIIAAANAEALAYDAEGFYGQEFGFYSVPAAGEAEYVNGGYFGPRGADGVIRTQSGRVASREPNLTPITERSEYSNRNSFMFGMHRPESLASPGLAQLINSPDYEGDMSLNALLKLRRGAWGGSQASLHSSAGSPVGGDDSSPTGQQPPWMAQNSTVTLPLGGHRRASSANSIRTSMHSDNGSVPGSPTLTMAGFAPLPLREGNKSTSTSPDKEKTEKETDFKKHRYTASAESISYLKEDDPASPTGERWILERRRTAESGEVELLGREVVSGGRI
ncbi:hypothetical protein B0O99DRAFT_502572 [Bisporella sp. PMI_857]|nr:hypothetical protein B0O99DRAFT_502572 [Bisporella sp. PMI_857]